MKKTIVVNLLLNTVGAFLYTVAINGFLISNHLGEGGVTGLMTIFYYWLKIAPSVTNIVLNGLLLLIGWKLLNKQTVFYTLYTITMISVFLRLIGSIRFPLHDPLVAALIGGALMGVAMGFIMKGEGTLAGSTILARIVNKFFGIKTGSAMLCFDLMVAIPSAVIIGFENMLLTIVELYLSAVILNKLLAQFVGKRSLTIISERFEELASALSDATKQGVTIIDGHGYVSGQKKQLLYCVCDTKDLVKLMNLITELDPKAFVVMEEVRSTYGKDLLRIL